MTRHNASKFSKSKNETLNLAVSLVLAILLVLAIALTTTAVASADDFRVTPVLPPTQNPDSHGFFDFTVTAGETQRIALEVGNTTSYPISVELTLATVVTNSNGIIDYTRSGEPDETMLHPFAEIARLGDGDGELVIEPYSTVEVPIYIEIPAEGFDGIILGSVVALLGVSEGEGEGGGGMFINRFQRVIAVRMQERDTIINPEFLLGDVGADVVNFRGAIVANVRNPMPRMVTGAGVSAWIYSADTNELVLSQEGMGVDFAPNTVFEFILTNPYDRRISSGDFVARLLVEHDGESWEFEREFYVPEEQVEEIDGIIDEIYRMPDDLDFSLPWWEELWRNLFGDLPIIPVLSIALGIVLVLIIAVILTMRSRKASKNAMKMFQDQMEAHMEAMEQRDNTTQAAIDALLAATTAKSEEIAPKPKPKSVKIKRPDSKSSPEKNRKR